MTLLLHTIFRFATTLTAATALIIVSPIASAQDDTELAPPTEKAEVSPPQDVDEADEQSLDDLLGIEEDASAESARETAEAEAQAELERALNEQQISDAFKEAIQKMAVSAELLGEKFDSGLGTQRIQEDIIKKLDVLIESAQKQQSNSSSSSSSSSQQQQQQNQQQPRKQQQNQQQQNQQNQAQNNANQNPTDSSSPQPPGSEAVDINSILSEDRMEWGTLPDRYRDQLLQAMKDKPSSLYKRLTDQYYKRLADEATK